MPVAAVWRHAPKVSAPADDVAARGGHGRVAAVGAPRERPAGIWLVPSRANSGAGVNSVWAPPAQGVRLRPALVGEGARPSFCFASRFKPEEVLNDPTKAAEFMRLYLDQEAKFFAIARHPDTGLTYDGVNLDLRTGQVNGIRDYSAPSKESLDLGVWIKALGGDKRAARVVAGGDVEAATRKAVHVLEQKLDSYWRYYHENPGYAGFMPWYLQPPSGKITPTDDWVGDIPGLDNGEWVWSLLTVEKALRDRGFTELADRYGKYNDMLRANVAKVFFDADAGKVRADVHICDPQSKDTRYESIADKQGRMSFLTGEHGVHEGMMLVLYLSLFGEGLAKSAVEKVWDGIPMKREERSRYGTTWQAYWGSAHESWAYLFLPLRDLLSYRNLFRIREVIRTQDAKKRGYFSSSINKPALTPTAGYLSAGGIPGIGSQEVKNNHVYALYATFPLLLQCYDPSDESAGNYGLAWLDNMLRARKAQGPLGGGESGTNDGTAIAPMKTIDGSFPIFLAMMGGVADETASMLRERGLYDRFCELMQRQYDRGFGKKPLREPCGFAMPRCSVPHDRMPDYVEATASNASDWIHPRPRRQACQAQR